MAGNVKKSYLSFLSVLRFCLYLWAAEPLGDGVKRLGLGFLREELTAVERHFPDLHPMRIPEFYHGGLSHYRLNCQPPNCTEATLHPPPQTAPMQWEKRREGATVRSEREREALVCPPWGRHRSKVSLPMGEFNLPCRHSWISYPAKAQPSAFVWRAGAYGTGDREAQETLSRMCAVPTWASLCSFVHSYCQY